MATAGPACHLPWPSTSSLAVGATSRGPSAISIFPGSGGSVKKLTRNRSPRPVSEPLGKVGAVANRQRVAEQLGQAEQLVRDEAALQVLVCFAVGETDDVGDVVVVEVERDRRRERIVGGIGPVALLRLR